MVVKFIVPLIAVGLTGSGTRVPAISRQAKTLWHIRES